MCEIFGLYGFNMNLFSELNDTCTNYHNGCTGIQWFTFYAKYLNTNAIELSPSLGLVFLIIKTFMGQYSDGPKSDCM